MTPDKKPVSFAEQASDWLAHFDRLGDVGPDTTLTDLTARDAEFSAWVNEGIHHRVAFLETLAAWHRTERLVVLSDRAGPQPRSWLIRRRGVLAGAVSAIAAAVCAAVILPMSGLMTPPPSIEPEVYFSQLGEQRTLTLDDGTRITLNTNSRVDIRYTEDVRLARLVRGEAFFEVARDEARPFRVDTPSGDVEVLGTVFAVELKDSAVEVAVTEGRVSLASEDTSEQPAEYLTSGMVGYADQSNVITETIGLEAVEDRLLWRTGRLKFSDMALQEVAAEFNRYSRVQLVIEDEKSASMRIGGTFAADNVEGFLRLAETGLGLRVERRGERVAISQK